MSLYARDCEGDAESSRKLGIVPHVELAPASDLEPANDESESRAGQTRSVHMSPIWLHGRWHSDGVAHQETGASNALARRRPARFEGESSRCGTESASLF